MASLIDRVTNFGRSPKGQSLVRQAMSRLSGGNDTRKGRRGNETRRGRRAGSATRRRRAGTRRR